MSGRAEIEHDGRSLKITPDEPELVPASRHTWVLVHGHGVPITVQLISGAENLPQQQDLAAYRLLRGRPEERPAPNQKAESLI